MRWIIDLDGVVWRDREIIWDNVDVIKKLKGKKVFLTNKATSRWEVSKRLKELGLEGEVVTSAYIASQFLKEKGVETAFAVGPLGLAEELASAGIHLTENEDLAQAVVAGLDVFLTYDKVARAVSMIRKGALFVATNADKTYPTERGLVPGAGSVVEAIRVASGKEPIIVGKPSKKAFEVASGGEREVVVIGDKMETDMKMALENGAKGILVLTGVTREPPKEVPEGVTVVRTLKELLGDQTG